MKSTSKSEMSITYNGESNYSIYGGEIDIPLKSDIEILTKSWCEGGT